MKAINQNSANVSLGKGQAEDTQLVAQMKRVFEAFYSQPKTMLMVSVETGVMRSNICWYAREWKEQNSIKIIRLGICPISKREGVQYLTTNPRLFPSTNQLNLF
jgi:hypothetical protein